MQRTSLRDRTQNSQPSPRDPTRAHTTGTQSECYRTPTVGTLGLGGGGRTAFDNNLALLGVRGGCARGG
jgi:hypothetical protein